MIVVVVAVGKWVGVEEGQSRIVVVAVGRREIVDLSAVRFHRVH
jgi:hypothetical protein